MLLYILQTIAFNISVNHMYAVNIVVSNSCAEAVMLTWAHFILASITVFLLLEVHGQVAHTNQHLQDVALWGWSGGAHGSQKRRGGRADKAG